jgi:hypothetical protein
MSTRLRDTTVRAQVVVEAPLERAISVFTEGFGSFKPPEHSMLPVEIAETVFEPRVGGHLYDRGVDGSECRWARARLRGGARWSSPRWTSTSGCASSFRRRARISCGRWCRTSPRRSWERRPTRFAAPATASARRNGSTSATATASGPGTRAWARSSSPSPSCAPARTFPTGCSSRAGGRSRRSCR